MLELDYPRQKAIAAMKASVPADIWRKNEEFNAALRKDVHEHPVSRHPAIAALNNGTFSKDAMRRIHLEYRHAIVQIFTDALLMAQHQTLQLEPRLAPGSKMAPRFLLTLNTLDEFGFRPGLDATGYYRGNPLYAHYPLFENVLTDLGVDQEGRRTFTPSAIATETRRFLEASYGDYALVAALLAVAEEEVVLFSPPLRQAAAAVGCAVDTGYYFVHGTSDDESAEAHDDDHEDDLWLVLAQAMTEDRHAEIRARSIEYCDLWVRFWDEQMRHQDRKDKAGDKAAAE